MNDEAAFLARIRETPDDVAPRLVYADWLDEHDDPRGELIRLTEEMRTLAPYSDAYWMLKPRRRELLRGVPDEWLDALGYLQVLPVLSHGVPDDWKGRWRLLREYVERWHDIEMPDVGGYAFGMTEIEQEIGRPLPPSVREWFAFLADVGADAGNGSCFAHLRATTSGDILPSHAGDLLLVGDTYTENGPHPLVVKLTDFDMTDPPLFSYQSNEFDPISEPMCFQHDCSLSMYGLRMSLDIGTTYDADVGHSFGPTPALEAELLRNHFFCCDDIDAMRVFEKRNMQVRFVSVDEGSYVTVRIARPVALADIPTTLQNDWDIANWRKRGMIL